jgi:hypothetical protein
MNREEAHREVARATRRGTRQENQSREEHDARNDDARSHGGPDAYANTPEGHPTQERGFAQDLCTTDRSDKTNDPLLAPQPPLETDEKAQGHENPHRAPNEVGPAVGGATLRHDSRTRRLPGLVHGGGVSTR